MDRAEIVHENFLRRVGEGDFPPRRCRMSLEDSGLTRDSLLLIYQAQVQSRHLDRVARILQAKGEGYYTIGSSGHEGCAAIAMALNPSDPAFLHYRDGAFQTARSMQLPSATPVWDMLLSFTSSSEDPISGGRHKVLGSKQLNIPPQTSTIASHLPKSVGAAYSLGLSQRIQPLHQEWDANSIVYCSFGDASFNHSTAQGSFNTAAWTSFQSIPLPLLFVCEDNGIGISTKTPDRWIEASISKREGLCYRCCDGLDPLDAYAAAKKLSEWVRTRRKPAFLHMNCVRLYGHAGVDIQDVYMSSEEILESEANDPLLHTARTLIENGCLSADDALSIYKKIGKQVFRVSEEVTSRPKLETGKQVMESIIPSKRNLAKSNGPSLEARAKAFGSIDHPSLTKPQTMSKLINSALTDLMLEFPEIIVAGEDVGRKGGVYGVTQNLQKRFGPDRVIDTILDEQSILGLAIGLGQNGFLPIPEIQFLAYLHNAEDQIRGEASTLPFFSNRQYSNPMVVRIAGLGYQRGFGGHFHNDNSIAVLRDIPGLIVACPSNGLDAVLMLRESVRLAMEEQRIVAFIEPIALYSIRDLHKPKDEGWLNTYPSPGEKPAVSLGQIGLHGTGMDLAIVTYGNGCYLSHKAKRILESDHNLGVRIIDMRWLSPIPFDAVAEESSNCGNVLIVDECRQTGSVSESLLAYYSEHTDQKVGRITALDSFISTGPAYAATLPSVDGIVDTALNMLIRKTGGKASK